MRRCHFRTRWRLLTLMLLTGALYSAAAAAEEDGLEAAFVNRWGRFTIRVSTEYVHPALQHDRPMRCEYTIDRDGQAVWPVRAEGGRLIGYYPIGSGRVRIEIIGEGDQAVGWMLGIGGIRGNTFSWQWTLVRPVRDAGGWRYEWCTFLGKNAPIVRLTDHAFEVWSQYQEWGHTGTALSFFVPEKRLVLRNPEADHGIFKADLPVDTAAWPPLKYLSPVGILVAGLTQFNPELMARAAEALDGADLDVLEAQGLPTTREALLQLADDVRRAGRLVRRFRHFNIEWGADRESAYTPPVRHLRDTTSCGNMSEGVQLHE